MQIYIDASESKISLDAFKIFADKEKAMQCWVRNLVCQPAGHKCLSKRHLPFAIEPDHPNQPTNSDEREVAKAMLHDLCAYLWAFAGR